MKRAAATLPLAVALAAVVLGACAPAPASQAPPDKQPAPTLEVLATAVPSPVAPSAEPPAEGELPPTEVPAPKPARTALEATDPTTVSLASGRPTLVEFFAFW